MIWTSFTLDLIVFLEGDKRYANDLNEFYAIFDCFLEGDKRYANDLNEFYARFDCFFGRG